MPNKLDLQKGVQIDIQELAKKLTLLGYTKDNVTSTEGFWSRRGEIIDIYQHPIYNTFRAFKNYGDNELKSKPLYKILPCAEKQTLYDKNIKAYNKLKKKCDNISLTHKNTPIKPFYF